MGRIIGWIMAVAGLVALFLAARFLGATERAADAEEGGFSFVLPVTLATLERGDLHPRVPLSGSVRAVRRAELSFLTSGLVQSLEVFEADEVVEGAFLARLYDGDAVHDLSAAKAALALAEREQDLLLAGEREEEKRRLLAELEASRAEEELARLEVERGEKLLVDRVIAQSEQDRRVAIHNAARQRRAASEAAHEEAVAGTRAEDLAIAAARVTEARTRVELAEHDLAKTRLLAPFAGTILRRFVSPGDYVAVGDPVFELADLENLEVDLEVPSRLAARLGKGSRVLLSLDGDEEFAVEHLLDATIPAADARARSFRAIVRLSADENPGRRLKPGMFVHVDLGLEPTLGELLVPSDCVLASERGPYVVRAEPAPDAPDGAAPAGAGGPPAPALVAAFVPVRVLAAADGLSAVRGLGTPLAAGDRVVLTGADNAFPGASLLARAPGAEPSPTQAEAGAGAAQGEEPAGKAIDE